VGLNFVGFDPIKALVFTAVINGLIAVPLLFFIAIINGRKNILGEHRGNLWSRVGIWLSFIVMGLSGVGLFYTLIFQ
jgi:Mn2+/Fe2+ NRAMP family transporter